MTLELYFQELVEKEGQPKHALLVNLSGLDNDEMDQFRRWWPSVSTERRQELMEWLVTVADDNVELDFNSIYLHGLTDSDPLVRERAVAGLWECDDRKILGPLITLLQEDPFEQVRASAATALGKFSVLAETGKLLPRDGERIKELLLAVADDSQESTEVRCRALEAAACFNTPRVRELIQWAYDCDEPKLQLSSLYAMGKTCDPAWLAILITETQNRDPAMRYEAACAFAEIGEEESAPYLIPLIQDEDTQVQLSAIRALGAIGGSLADRALKRCLKHDDQVVQEAAQETLEMMEAESDPLGFTFQRWRG